jgi:hypothetical protein
MLYINSLLFELNKSQAPNIKKQINHNDPISKSQTAEHAEGFGHWLWSFEIYLPSSINR